MISLSPQLIRNSIVLVIFILFLCTLYWGWSTGKKIAISNHTIQTVTTLHAGLSYFWEDQGRFPSASEFGNTEVMRMYFDRFPPKGLVTKTCPEVYDYYTNAGKEYTLTFCIPRQASFFPAGTSEITQNSNLGN